MEPAPDGPRRLDGAARHAHRDAAAPIVALGVHPVGVEVDIGKGVDPALRADRAAFQDDGHRSGARPRVWGIGTETPGPGPRRLDQAVAHRDRGVARPAVGGADAVGPGACRLDHRARVRDGDGYVARRGGVAPRGADAEACRHNGTAGQADGEIAGPGVGAGEAGRSLVQGHPCPNPPGRVPEDPHTGKRRCTRPRDVKPRYYP